jgi:GntR family transcriptional regulator
MRPLTVPSRVCHIIDMTPFRFSLTTGESIFDQVVYAATRAFVSGEMQPGDPFPSVRSLAADLKIHPNTAAKVVQHLIQQGWLEARPGKGTVVAQPPRARSSERQRLLKQEIEQLAVEAKRVGLSLAEVTEALTAQWKKLDDSGSSDAA